MQHFSGYDIISRNPSCISIGRQGKIAVSDDYKFFSAGTAATFRAAAERIVPGEPGAPGAGSEQVLMAVDRELAGRDADLRKNLTMFLKVVELLPVFRYGRPFSRLGPAQQDAVLKFFGANRLVQKFRMGFWGMKTFVLLGYYNLESTWAELDYPGPRRDAPYYAGRDGGDSA